MAYFTRSVAKPSGYYASLHSRSSADMYDHRGESTSLRTPLQGDELNIYEVDRLIGERKTKSGVQYLVMWKDYRKEDATWVPEFDITPPALQ